MMMIDNNNNNTKLASEISVDCQFIFFIIIVTKCNIDLSIVDSLDQL